MKIFTFILLSFFCSVSGQRPATADSLRLRDAADFLADDYGNIYIYQHKDFSFTKYDSLGMQQGRLLHTLPFKIQSVQNPLNIPAFSENAQEVRFYDQNLNEIQVIRLRESFGFIKMAYAEDLQQIWLLDESTKTLIQYNFREARIVNSFPLNIDFDAIIDLLVYDNTAYILTKYSLIVYNYRRQKTAEIAVTNAGKLRRENSQILLIGNTSVSKFNDGVLSEIFTAPDARIVDKNSGSYFEVRGSKVYLYPINH